MNNNKKQNVEILAPAGNFESLKVAIDNGANAVYLGLEDFNARNNIENFNTENLHEVVDYAHFFNVKIYITINVLIKDDEFEKIIDIVKKSLQANVDAFIVQDIGLAYYLKQKFPNIELHASTQMGFNNLEGVLFAKKLGFKRVVLARETPLAEVKRIKENCDIELEYFIQGALCVAYSGNCYLCSLLANSSGNRGQCKQFCRLAYSMKNGNISKDGYLLSTKDFCMIPKLKDLIDAGIYSLKIEGRARRPAYVAQSVKTYRKIIDNNFNFSDEDILDLKKVFNRGNFACGYFDNNNIIYSKCQNHIGVEIGKVIDFVQGKKFNEVFIKSNYKIKKGDVIKFFKNDKEIGIVAVNDSNEKKCGIYRITTTNHIENNSIARLIVDSDKEKELLTKHKQIYVDIDFYAKQNQKAKLILKTQNINVEIESDFFVEKAKSSPINETDCKTQFSKLGKLFSLKSFFCEIGNVFIAKSQLNQLRRQALEKLKQEMINDYNNKNNINKKRIEADDKIFISNSISTSKKMALIDKFDNFEKFKNKYDLFIFQPNTINTTEIKELYNKYNHHKVFISFPIMVNEKEIEIIKSLLDYCKNWGIYANNYYTLSLTTPDRIVLGSNMNVFNSYTIKFYKNIGIEKIVLTIEDIDRNLIQNNGTSLFSFTKFYPEYMYLKHCPLKEHFSSKCDNCLYKNNLSCKLNNKEFVLLRRKFLQCNFVLKSKALILTKTPENISSIEEIF